MTPYIADIILLDYCIYFFASHIGLSEGATLYCFLIGSLNVILLKS